MSQIPPPPPPSDPGPGPSPEPTPGGSTGAAPASADQSPQRLLAAMFDFTFSTFVTPIIVRAAYLLATVVIGLLWLVALVAGFASSAGSGLVVLIVGPFVALVYLLFIRMTLEFYQIGRAHV